MAVQKQTQHEEAIEVGQNQEPNLTNKKKFIEPEISMPVDVLEATTFFQSVDSGATN